MKRNGEWISWTYEEYYAASRAAARGLLAVGLERQKGVGIMGFNSPEMIFSFLASVFAGGLSCGIYPTSSGETVSYLGRRLIDRTLLYEIMWYICTKLHFLSYASDLAICTRFF